MLYQIHRCRFLFLLLHPFSTPLRAFTQNVVICNLYSNFRASTRPNMDLYCNAQTNIHTRVLSYWWDLTIFSGWHGSRRQLRLLFIHSFMCYCTQSSGIPSSLACHHCYFGRNERIFGCVYKYVTSRAIAAPRYFMIDIIFCPHYETYTRTTLHMHRDINSAKLNILTEDSPRLASNAPNCWWPTISIIFYRIEWQTNDDWYRRWWY